MAAANPAMIPEPKSTLNFFAADGGVGASGLREGNLRKASS
jgi:hypothetical protein